MRNTNIIKTIIPRFTRWTVLALTSVTLAVTMAASASAGTLPWLSTQTFSMNATPEHEDEVSLYISWQDTAGNFIVEAKHPGRSKVIGTGKVTEVNPLNYAITFQYSLSPGMKYSYSGSIRQWGGPAPTFDAKWFMAGSFTINMQTIYGTALVGPRPFCAKALYIAPAK